MRQKKVDVKMTQKLEVMEIVTKALEAQGLRVADGEDYGFTKGTIVISGNTCDIQLKPITPAKDKTRYEVIDE